ncbi:MAG: MFS transporter [Prevotella sp.]|nr:MFS transporter [Prevotella sp.]
MQNNNQKGRAIAIVAMIFLFGMIAFVTNLAAPIGVIWKNQPALQGSNTLGMLGNMMNFLAYLFMGIPSGKLLTKVGYKKTALMAIACGFLGVFIQYLSGQIFTDGLIAGLPANFYVYLLGAFVTGISVCMLNTVVNPMLNLLGGGGNKGNQLLQVGGTLNSFMGTLTPMFVGALIGVVTKDTAITDINVVLYLAMTIFALTFVILSFIPIADPEGQTENTTFEHSPFAFRHFSLGVIAIFFYVGTEVGIPGTLNFFLSDTTTSGAGLSLATAATIGGFAAGTYWFLMLIGRFVAGLIASKVSSKLMMTVTCCTGISLILLAIFLPKTVTGSMPVFTGSGFEITTLPLSAILLVLCGLCTSVMWSCIFNLATEGLGKYTAQASGIFMTMVVGGGILPLVQNSIADHTSYMFSYIVPLIGMAYMLFFAVWGHKNVNKDIAV